VLEFRQQFVQIRRHATDQFARVVVNGVEFVFDPPKRPGRMIRLIRCSRTAAAASPLLKVPLDLLGQGRDLPGHFLHALLL